MIRHATAHTMTRDAVVLDLGDLSRQAERIKANARAEAELILAEARAERERIMLGAAEEGRSDGFARGREEGLEEGRAAGREAAMAECSQGLAQLDASWTEALKDFERRREEMLASARQDVLRLALRIGEMVTKRVIAAKPEVVVDQLDAVLALVVRPTRLVVAAHPDDLPLLEAAMPSLSSRVQHGHHVQLVADATLDRGSCVARTAAVPLNALGETPPVDREPHEQSSSTATDRRGSEIDASIATQLARIVAGLCPAGGSALPPSGESHPETEHGW